MSNIQCELLAPVSSLQKVEYAFAYGADAVYAGLSAFSLRARENEFDHESLERACAYTRELNRKLYLTANVFARNVKLQRFNEALDVWAQIKPHALIMSDPGLIMRVREKFPDLPIHLSVQANCMNWQSVKFWQQVGVQRIILSRELRLDEIREIKQRVPEIELEAFVHGSVCIAYSGRCLLSHYLSYRDANQGICDNSCRYLFHLYKAENTLPDYYIEDLRQRGEFLQIDEDEHGTYIMNAKDLCLIEYLSEIRRAGVTAFKIEGRTKSLYYVVMATRAYRKALDDLIAERPFNQELLREVAKIANRGYHAGFMVGQMAAISQNYDTSVARHFSQRFAGIVTGYDNGWIKVEVRNKLEPGQCCEVISPQTNHVFTITKMRLAGKEVLSAHGGAGIYEFAVDFVPPPFAILSVMGE